MAVIFQLSSRRQTLCLTVDHCSSPLEFKQKKKAKNIFYILYIHTSIHVLIIVIDFTHSAWMCNFPNGLSLSKQRPGPISAASPSFSGSFFHTFADPLQSLQSLSHYHPTGSTLLLLVGVMTTLVVWISSAVSAWIMASCTTKSLYRKPLLWHVWNSHLCGAGRCVGLRCNSLHILRPLVLVLVSWILKKLKDKNPLHPYIFCCMVGPRVYVWKGTKEGRQRKDTSQGRTNVWLKAPSQTWSPSVCFTHFRSNL